MREYLKVLWAALCGHDLNGERLLAAERERKRMEEDMRSMRIMYLKAVEQWGEAEKREKECGKREAALQRLVENLREHSTEKDEMMRRMKVDYQQRIEQYTREIDRLRGELKKSGMTLAS